MKFDPIARILYTDGNQLIKKLNCPVRMRWEELSVSQDPRIRQCAVCSRPIIDTERLTDEAAASIAKADPSACFKVDLNQANVRVVHHHG